MYKIILLLRLSLLLFFLNMLVPEKNIAMFSEEDEDYKAATLKVNTCFNGTMTNTKWISCKEQPEQFRCSSCKKSLAIIHQYKAKQKAKEESDKELGELQKELLRTQIADRKAQIAARRAKLKDEKSPMQPTKILYPERPKPPAAVLNIINQISELNQDFQRITEQLQRPIQVPIPDVARGHEDVYERFLRGKLVYKPDPKSDKGMVVLPIADLANPLEGEFDLSKCGDEGKCLSINTGYRKGKRPENADKVEIWFAPRFLIEKNLEGSASHFKPIMGSWDALAWPLGAFITQSHWDLENYDYNTTKLSFESDNDFNTIYETRSGKTYHMLYYHMELMRDVPFFIRFN